MRSVLIPGGAGGLGSKVTTLFLQNGYQVLVPYSDSQQVQQLHDSFSDAIARNNLILIAADALSESGVEKIYGVIDAQAEALYGLIHLLGGIRSFIKVSETSTGDWDYLLSLNLRSFFLFAKEAMKRFERAGEGRIVSIGAMAALKPSAKQTAYAVSKSGVIALTKILADEGREIGVTANCIVPSVIVTPANLEWGSEEDMKKWVTPDDIARMILYLCSDDARSTNGSVIQMFGKMNL